MNGWHHVWMFCMCIGKIVNNQHLVVFFQTWGCRHTWQPCWQAGGICWPPAAAQETLALVSLRTHVSVALHTEFFIFFFIFGKISLCVSPSLIHVLNLALLKKNTLKAVDLNLNIHWKIKLCTCSFEGLADERTHPIASDSHSFVSLTFLLHSSCFHLGMV